MKPLHKVTLLGAALLLAVSLLLGFSAHGGAERPTLYVFTSPTSAGCVQDYGVVEKITGMGLVTVKIIVAEQSPDEMQQWGVKMLPCYLYFKGGGEQWRTYQAEIARRWILQDSH